MKTFIKLLAVLQLIFCLPIIAQEINMHSFIGFSVKEITARMGKPAYQDNSNPSMICTFYKTQDSRYAFVSNEKGVFQAEACLSLESKQGAEKLISNLIKNCKEEGYTSDTLNTDSYCVHTVKVKMELNTSLNKTTNKFDVRIKATRRE